MVSGPENASKSEQSNAGTTMKSHRSDRYSLEIMEDDGSCDFTVPSRRTSRRNVKGALDDPSAVYCKELPDWIQMESR